jgi:hypothetical protein
VPGGNVGIFEHHDAARTDEPEVGGHLFWPATEWGDLVSSVDQVERSGLQGGGEQIVVPEQHVAESLVGRELFGLGEHGVVDVGSHDLAFSSGPFAEQSQPPHHAAADVDSPGAATADLLQEAASGGLPHPRLESEPLQLGHLTGQQVFGRAHGDLLGYPSWGSITNVRAVGRPGKCKT